LEPNSIHQVDRDSNAAVGEGVQELVLNHPRFDRQEFLAQASRSVAGLTREYFCTDISAESLWPRIWPSVARRRPIRAARPAGSADSGRRVKPMRY
jgi:hypothetical protein